MACWNLQTLIILARSKLESFGLNIDLWVIFKCDGFITDEAPKLHLEKRCLCEVWLLGSSVIDIMAWEVSWEWDWLLNHIRITLSAILFTKMGVLLQFSDLLTLSM